MDAKKLFIFSLVIMAMAMASESARAPSPSPDPRGVEYFNICLRICSETYTNADCDAECMDFPLGHGKCLFTGPGATEKACCCHGKL